MAGEYIVFGWLGIPIGLLLGFALIRYVSMPRSDRQHARELYGEDNCCKKTLHAPMHNDSRCMFKGDMDHCCHCAKMYCKWEFARKNGLFWWYDGKKKGLLKYIKKHKLTPYPEADEKAELVHIKYEKDLKLEQEGQHFLLEQRLLIESFKNRKA